MGGVNGGRGAKRVKEEGLTHEGGVKLKGGVNEGGGGVNKGREGGGGS